MDWYKTVLRYYEIGIYTKGDVWDFVSYAKITDEQYTLITKDEYPTERPTEHVTE